MEVQLFPSLQQSNCLISIAEPQQLMRDSVGMCGSEDFLEMPSNTTGCTYQQFK